MEPIIKKAIEGGYKKERYYFDENGNFDDEPYEVVLMKSSFWQALGKACGWEKYYCLKCEKGFTTSGIITCPRCLKLGHYDEGVGQALTFHRINLTEGWDKAVEYLNSLIS